MSTTKLTRQGVRDLGGAHRRRRPTIAVCQHVWEREVEYACDSWWDEARTTRVVLRCGFCGEVRR